ncbi:hypothetical protein OZX57_05825 [Bifidobacterium sp. ESL0682]|uniref:hypothetical protein n=1 Tax=Bifidobacterium sp. ESL0682 TaxID=2983212 RepID=UPI0023F6D780|nr:hypothetical protein [Bifidobacterium sp. ESL0682]WEV41533.1 hypothetical protein OZX57_05825 [Bifidobacterium sp. ESL0682]
MALLVMPALASCTPNNAAVGDTASVSGHVPHDSVDKSDMLIGVVTAGDAQLDRTVLNAFNKAGIKAIYAQAPYGGMALDPVQSFKDMARRPVRAFVVDSLDMGGQLADSWTKSLQSARNAGIPVILVNAVKPPADGKLYAESLHIVSSDQADSSAQDGKGAIPLDQAVQSAVNDNPHAKTMSVTLP